MPTHTSESCTFDPVTGLPVVDFDFESAGCPLCGDSACAGCEDDVADEVALI